MTGLDPVIHALPLKFPNVDGRIKSGHDAREISLDERHEKRDPRKSGPFLSK
jgi:hypothetical protein